MASQYKYITVEKNIQVELGITVPATKWKNMCNRWYDTMVSSEIVDNYILLRITISFVLASQNYKP